MSTPRLLACLAFLILCRPIEAKIHLRDVFDAKYPPSLRKTSSRNTVRQVPEGLTFSKKVNLQQQGGAVSVRGFGERDNPLRYRLSSPMEGDVYVRFLLRYDASSIDKVPEGDGEFFVLWLDAQGDSDTATHSSGIPNVGIHVATTGLHKDKNVFMARVGVQDAAFSDVEVLGDRTYLVVARLSKSDTGKQTPYTQLEMWVDPDPKDKSRPLVKVNKRQAIDAVSWIGFATGRKTEPSDAITLDELAVGTTWESVLGLPEVASTKKPTPIRTRRDVDFRREVYPILKSRCFECHRGPDADAGYRLDVRAEILGENNGYPLAILGQSTKSRLIALVRAPQTSDDKMPPEGNRLREKEIAILRDWIDNGMSWDDGLLPPIELKSDHWAFQPIERPEVPMTRASWVRNPIDAFIAKRQEEVGTEVSPSANRRVLIRRLYLDLLGLTPTPEAVQNFVEDDSPLAYEQLVERLLSSPHHGERWGRHWLDLARWAESNGHQHNKSRAHAWRYRDYVVRSFNENKPYDRFLLEQLAGDEMEPFSEEGLIATGFLAAARYSGNELDKTIQRNDLLVDVVNATSSSLLALTLGCAQCHNHKFDPLSARDYYRFQGFFVRGQPVDLILRDQGEGTLSAAEQIEIEEMVRERMAIFEATRARLVQRERQRRPKGEILVIRTSVLKGMTSAERARYDALGKRIDSLRHTWSFYSPATSPHRVVVNPQTFRLRWPLDYTPAKLRKLQPRLWVRGEVSNPGPIVDVGWPALFGPVADRANVDKRPRTALARWLTSRENPLTARVWVNRLWHYHFGRGIVATTNNFGTQGADPTHPQLLDWLACELIDSGWDTRRIHRLILGSHTYRQASYRKETNVDLDGEERTYWRWKPRRLEAEAIRDGTLTVSGQLDRRIGGVGATDVNSPRRALYLFQRRAKLPRMQTLFNAPEAVESCGGRRVSTVPLQPLYLLNNPFMVESAERFARRVRRLAGDDLTRQVSVAFELALSRHPDDIELSKSLAYLESPTTEGEDRLTGLCHVILNLSEFVYVQ